jgi:hypothetical protein
MSKLPNYKRKSCMDRITINEYENCSTVIILKATYEFQIQEHISD